MRPTLFLRIASLLSLIFCAGHTVGGVLSPPAPGVQTDVVQVMRSGSFNAMGYTRTFWDFHVGYGILLAVTLLVQSIVFWQLSSLAKTEAARLRPMLVLFALQSLALAPIAVRYFFLGPGLISVAIAACLAAAFYTAGVP